MEDGFWTFVSRHRETHRDQVGNIGYYYGTKDDLMVNLAEYIFDHLENAAAAGHAAVHDPRAGEVPLFHSLHDRPEQEAKAMFGLLEMWAMANRSLAVSKMMDTFYGRLRGSIDGMIADLNPKMAADTRALRAALITTQIEGLIASRRAPQAQAPRVGGHRTRGHDPGCRTWR